MPLTDTQFLDSTRGLPVPELGDRHIDEASGVRLCGLMLYTLARVSCAKRLLEIGVSRGCTTIPLLQAAKETGGKLNSIDPAGCDAARETVERLGYGEFWEFHQMTSDDYFAKFGDQVIDLAFIDGDHWQPFVERDIKNVMWRLSCGGWCVLHDWSPAERKTLETYQNRRDDHGYGIARAALSTLPLYLPLDMIPVAPGQPGAFPGVEGGFLMIHKPWSPNDVTVLRGIRDGGYCCKVEE